MNYFKVLTPATYWILIIMWFFILFFYLKRLKNYSSQTKLIYTLIVILAIDAFRSLFESIYFGFWYTSLAGFLPKSIYTFLVRPEMVFIPKIINVIAAGIIIAILLYKWLPQEEQEKYQLENLINLRTEELNQINIKLKNEIQEKEKAEIEKERLQKKLHQGLKMKSIGILAGGIAHDFNNILGVVLGNIEYILNDTNENDSNYNNLIEAEKGCLKARDVVRQILVFSRESKLDMKVINFNETISDSLIFLRSLIPSNIELKTDFSDEVFYVSGDSTQIHQIIMNLCNNSIQAMNRKDGMINVSTMKLTINNKNKIEYNNIKNGNYVQLCIRDNGKGIKAEDHNRIFDPYFTTKDINEGSGLGLSVVHGIVNNHKGTILFDSEENKGTVFKILFPVTEKSIDKKNSKNKSILTGDETILLVDDDVSILKINSLMLRKLGYKVHTENNASQALKFFKENHKNIDLVITDMTMPELTGDILAKQLIEIKNEIPVILCTGYNKNISLKNYSKSGIRRYLEKPVRMEIISKIVREVLDE